ncbi:MAG: hypothetical protein JSV88_07185 [Candidatus Aminicenantes bacterium]|nr:MAG: hypothetical protein JSV88_07185 [Candidatus Aminicenantes bacterium]
MKNVEQFKKSKKFFYYPQRLRGTCHTIDMICAPAYLCIYIPALLPDGEMEQRKSNAKNN